MRDKPIVEDNQKTESSAKNFNENFATRETLGEGLS